jgi:hypothetical protein
MNYQTIFGERKLKIFSDKAPLPANVICQGMVIVEKNCESKNFKVRTDLSDFPEGKEEQIIAAFADISKLSLCLDVCEAQQVFKLYLIGLDLVTNEQDTAVHLFTSGVITSKMKELSDAMTGHEDLFFEHNPYSAEAYKLSDQLNELYPSMDSDRWLNFANSNTYQTENTRQIFYSWAEKLFIETTFGIKHRALLED